MRVWILGISSTVSKRCFGQWDVRPIDSYHVVWEFSILPMRSRRGTLAEYSYLSIMAHGLTGVADCDVRVGGDGGS